MMRSKFALSAVTPKTVIGLSVLLLILAAIFGLLNSHKVKTLRTNVANANAARNAAEHRGVAQERNPRPVKRLLREEKRKSRKQKVRPQRLKQN